MTRRSYIVNPNPPYNLIPAEEYERPSKASFHIMPDIEPFVSPVDRKIVKGRRDLREHNRRHNVTNASDFSPQYYANIRKERQKQAKKERIQSLREAYERNRK